MQGKKSRVKKNVKLFLRRETRRGVGCNKRGVRSDIYADRREADELSCRRRCSLQGHDWQAIVRDHGPAVWRTAYRLLANHNDAADCFQETFLAAFEIACREPVRNVPGLLVRLATTRAIDRLRQRTRLEQRRTDSNERQEPGGAADPLDLVHTNELAAQLREQIGRLPPQEARVFCLRYLDDMSYRQIARELNIAISVVGVSLYRAKARLRAVLADTKTEDDEVSHAKKT